MPPGPSVRLRQTEGPGDLWAFWNCCDNQKQKAQSPGWRLKPKGLQAQAPLHQMEPSPAQEAQELLSHPNRRQRLGLWRKFRSIYSGFPLDRPAFRIFSGFFFGFRLSGLHPYWKINQPWAIRRKRGREGKRKKPRGLNPGAPLLPAFRLLAYLEACMAMCLFLLRAR